MRVKRAKLLTSDQLGKALAHVDDAARDPLRDRMMILLSFRAGLRACEIAGLDWSDATDAEGVVRDEWVAVQ